jgi:magnesium-transporting ATPase (P-type)
MHKDAMPRRREPSNVSWREGGVIMRRSLVRIFYLSGLAVAVVGVVTLLFSLANGVTTTTNVYGGTTTTPNNTALFVVGIVIISLGSLAVTVAWIGALIRTAQLGEWTWFVLLLVFQGITLLVYVIAGPDQLRQTADIRPNAPPPPTGS